MIRLNEMKFSKFDVRRATLDDLPALRALWEQNLLPVDEFEKRFTEFKVVYGDDDVLIGAVGILVVKHQALVHSEAFLFADWEDRVRPLLWDRIQVVAHNFGIARLWTLEKSPFWVHFAGFKPATAAEMESFPIGFGDEKAGWLCIQLRDENQAAEVVEKQLAIFKQAQEQELEAVRLTASRLRKVALVIAFGFLLAVIGGGLYLVRQKLLPGIR